VGDLTSKLSLVIFRDPLQGTYCQTLARLNQGAGSELEQRIVNLSQEMEQLDKLVADLEEEHKSHDRGYQAFNKHRERLNKSHKK